MINLFNIPNFNIDTSKFSNLLHDKIVTEFEENFCEYVGCKYGVALNSATSAIFLLFRDKSQTVLLPSLIPPVVANAIINGDNEVQLIDHPDWVGSAYLLNTLCYGVRIIDSAQQVEREQFKNYLDSDIVIFSFYPTKPVGGCDGGIICSNNENIIDYIRSLAYNGMSTEPNNWERTIQRVGHKMYMSSIQAYCANESLNKLDVKKQCLEVLRHKYNNAFGIANSSDHLYRIKVGDNISFINKAKDSGITCGIHYKALHLNPLYESSKYEELPLSEEAAKTMVSLPFHENLTMAQINKVIEFVNENG